MSRHSAYKAAIGPQDGDTLELRNQWARVMITVHAKNEDGECYGPVHYVCTGDLYHDFRPTKIMTFPTMRRALDYAMESLAVYQEGRAS
jgi:hypothetical protein